MVVSGHPTSFFGRNVPMLTIYRSVGRNGSNLANDVMHIQLLLNANVAKITPLRLLVVDGESGSLTEGAIEEFQRRAMRMTRPNGRIDPGGATMQQLIPTARFSAPANLTAQFEGVRFAGKTRQMMTGRITVNNHTYYFNSGGHGRGNLPPGRYTVTEHRKSRREQGYSFGGVGYTFAMSDKFDPRVGGDDRSLLRIHPDGGAAGTKGCIGILGGPQTQRDLRDDIYAELKRGKGSFILNVRRL